MIIAIDGHASTGKSTVAKALAHRLDYTYVDSGAMYRAVTLYFVKNQINIDDIVDVADALGNISIRFDYDYDTESNRTILNEEDITNEIRSTVVADNVSRVAAIKLVRSFLVKQQKAVPFKKGIVMDGRDIGTVVFPDADVKFFMTADVEIRAERRRSELKEKGIEASYEDVKQNLIQRDEIDSTRLVSPLKIADDAIIINNSNYNQEEQLQIMLEKIEVSKQN